MAVLTGLKHGLVLLDEERVHHEVVLQESVENPELIDLLQVP